MVGHIDQAAENAGLSKLIDMSFACKDIRNILTSFGINVDHQLKMQLTSIINGSDIIQSIFILIILIVTVFLSLSYYYLIGCYLHVLVLPGTILKKLPYKGGSLLS